MCVLRCSCVLRLAVVVCVKLMAPKATKKRPAAATVSARRKRLSSLAGSNKKRKVRRQVATALNKIADQLGVSHLKLDRKSPTSEQLEKLLRVVNARSPTAAVVADVRTATQTWLANGGTLSTELEDESEAEQTPAEDDVPSPVSGHKLLKPNFRLRSKAFMMTYNSRSFTEEDWPDFRKFVLKQKKAYGARAWAANLEESLHADVSGGQRVFHMHGYLFWNDGVGIDKSDLSDLYFKSVRPRIDTCRQQKSAAGSFSAACHGLWYVSFAKEGTKFTDTNYPAWMMYDPKIEWVQALWRVGKITHDHFLQISASEFRVGHTGRKRDVNEVQAWEREQRIDDDIRRELKELHETQPLSKLKTFPEIEEFVKGFRDARWRRPVLAIIGATNTGKSLLAADVLKRVGEVLGVHGMVEITVELSDALDFSDFDRASHSGVLLDGVGDLAILKENREAIQGRPKKLKGGKSSTMMYSYPYSLCRRAVVATFDLSARNLHMFRTDHWLRSSENVVQLWLQGPAWQATGSSHDVLGSSSSNTGTGKTWNVDAVGSFLEDADLKGPAHVFKQNGVNGKDFAAFTMQDLQQELRLTPFAARKVLLARDESGLF